VKVHAVPAVALVVPSTVAPSVNVIVPVVSLMPIRPALLV
jgi:hypothetical protein